MSKIKFSELDEIGIYPNEDNLVFKSKIVDSGKPEIIFPNGFQKIFIDMGEKTFSVKAPSNDSPIIVNNLQDNYFEYDLDKEEDDEKIYPKIAIENRGDGNIIFYIGSEDVRVSRNGIPGGSESAYNLKYDLYIALLKDDSNPKKGYVVLRYKYK